MKRLTSLHVLIMGLAALIFLSSWGFLVHRTINQLAVYQLPKSMQPFFYQQMDYVVKHAVRADERRNTDKTEASKHFIDAEAFGTDSALWQMPTDWHAAVARYTKDTLEKYGYVPYWVMVMKARLTEAFRQKNRDSILFYAADLGHYVGDAHVPLHTTLNYDGQLTGQKGLHSLWESTIPELHLKDYKLYNRYRAKYLKDPEATIWNVVRTSYAMLDDMLAEEREASKGFADSIKYNIQMRNGRESRRYSAAFARAYAARLDNTVNQRLLHSANRIADFWYTCWVDGGKPKLNILLDTPLTKEQKRKLKEEWQLYKKNQLLQHNLLIARKNAATPAEE
jgi:hypothetical protein